MSVIVKNPQNQQVEVSFEEACQKPGMYRPVSQVEECILVVGVGAGAFKPIIVRPENPQNHQIQTDLTNFKHFKWVRAGNVKITIESDKNGNV